VLPRWDLQVVYSEHQRLKEFILAHISAPLLEKHSCWIWTGSVHPRWKYPYQHWNGVRNYVHRLVYEKFRGPLSRGDVVKRTCGHSLCVNPDHLVRQHTRKEACALPGHAPTFLDQPGARLADSIGLHSTVASTSTRLWQGENCYDIVII